MPAVSRRNQKAVKKTVRRKSKRNLRKKNTKRNIRKTFKKNRKGLRGGWPDKNSHTFNVGEYNSQWQSTGDDDYDRDNDKGRDDWRSTQDENNGWNVVNALGFTEYGFNYNGVRADNCCDSSKGRGNYKDGKELCKPNEKVYDKNNEVIVEAYPSCHDKDETDAKLDSEEEKKRKAAAADFGKKIFITGFNTDTPMIKGGKKKHYKK